MKKISTTVICFLLLVFCFAQPVKKTSFPGTDDFKKAMKGGLLDIDATKNIAELKEVVTLTVTMVVTDDDGNPGKYDYRPEEPATAPWFVTGWKIVEGGGKLVSNPQSGNNYYAVLTTPDAMPAGKCVIVEVTMQSLDKNFPQVILRKTVYLQDNKNVFYFNCSMLGIKQEKYIIGGGAIQKTDAAVSAAAKNKTAEKNTKVANDAVQYYQKQIDASIRAEASGFNIDALTANAKAIYAKDEDVTTLSFIIQSISMVNGKTVNTKTNRLVAISFKGQQAGTFKIKENKTYSATITLPDFQTACTCADSPEAKKEREEEKAKGNEVLDPICLGGFITITKYDVKNKVIEGSIIANVESATPANPPIRYTGDLEGKFSVPLAN